MTKRDFFNIMIKLFGLYLLAFWTVPSLNFVSNAIYIYGKPEIWQIVLMYLVVVAFVALIILAIFKSSWIVSVLHLEHGFDDERIDFGQLKTSDILRMAIFIAGGILFVQNIGVFVGRLVDLFGSKINGGVSPTMNGDFLVIALNVALGIILMTYFGRIADWFEKRGGKNHSSNSQKDS